jgi:hypothetical protein
MFLENFWEKDGSRPSPHSTVVKYHPRKEYREDNLRIRP